MLNYARPGNAVENHVSEENKIKVQSLDPALRVLINEIGVYELIFGSNLPQAKEFRNFVFKVILPNFRKQLLPDVKLIGNQFIIKNEMDLHQKAVSYIRKYYPDVCHGAAPPWGPGRRPQPPQASESNFVARAGTLIWAPSMEKGGFQDKPRAPVCWYAP
jgi:hypothetical protein